MSGITDGTYGCTVRLVRELANLRAALCECSQIIAVPTRDYDYEYVVWQIKTLVGNVEAMAASAADRFAKIEPQVTANVATFAIKRPDGWLTTTAMVLDAAWRSVHQINRQWSQADTPADTVMHRLVRCADALAAFDNIDLMLSSIAAEMRSVAISTASQQAGGASDPWVFVEIGHMKFTHKTAGEWAKDDSRPWFRRVSRGKYECQRARLREVVDARHWQKYGIE